MITLCQESRLPPQIAEVGKSVHEIMMIQLETHKPKKKKMTKLADKTYTRSNRILYNLNIKLDDSKMCRSLNGSRNFFASKSSLSSLFLSSLS